MGAATGGVFSGGIRWRAGRLNAHAHFSALSRSERAESQSPASTCQTTPPQATSQGRRSTQVAPRCPAPARILQQTLCASLGSLSLRRSRRTPECRHTWAAGIGSLHHLHLHQAHYTSGSSPGQHPAYTGTRLLHSSAGTKRNSVRCTEQAIDWGCARRRPL